MTNHLIASAPSIEALEKMLQNYFYSPSVTIVNGCEVHNSKGHMKSYTVTNKKGRYRFERIPQAN